MDSNRILWPITQLMYVDFGFLFLFAALKLTL